VEFIDLLYQQELIRKKIDKNIKAVMKHGQFIMGPEVELLEGKTIKIY